MLLATKRARTRCPFDGPWRQVQRSDLRHRNVPVCWSDERLAGVVDQTGFVYLYSSRALDDFLRRRYGCDLRIRRHPLQYERERCSRASSGSSTNSSAGQVNKLNRLHVDPRGSTESVSDVFWGGRERRASLVSRCASDHYGPALRVLCSGGDLHLWFGNSVSGSGEVR